MEQINLTSIKEALGKIKESFDILLEGVLKQFKEELRKKNQESLVEIQKEKIKDKDFKDQIIAFNIGGKRFSLSRNIL